MRQCATPAVAFAIAAALAGISGCASVPRVAGEARAALPMASAGTAQRAAANLAAASGTLASGRLDLQAEPGALRVRGTLGGLRAGAAHLLQVHERGDCSAVDARSAGAAIILAPGSGPVAGRLRANRDGRAELDLRLDDVVLGGGARNDVAGRALVLVVADGVGAGTRVACGVIAVQP